ncbi:MAG: hypothetical protein A3C53_04045 [Omnitrophica WOR_2 bacterium RIFCSPHIGHO2_02_FULL_68_15]|nr:MAG: hypothetical protein A3C53_04045 [Omnitrophica WOR_2 bacterium RIFCSPHIGHO2_02_FULL_68_15]
MAADVPTVFLDANILFSAAYDAESRSAVLFAEAHRGRCAVVTSPYAIAEARRSLAKKYPEALASLDRYVRQVRLVRDTAPAQVREATDRHLVPMEDAPILAAALQAGVDYLVTGDRAHFGHLMDRAVPGLPVRVLSLAKALDLF